MGTILLVLGAAFIVVAGWAMIQKGEYRLVFAFLGLAMLIAATY